MALRAEMVGPDPPIHSEDYLEARFRLFEKFCYPSVRNQTTQDFSWIVAFSAGTPKRYRERIARLAEAMPNLRPVFLDADAASRFFAELDSYLDLGDGVTRVITSRVCNDDSLAADYMERTQAICDARPDEEYFVSYPRGLRLSVRHGFSCSVSVTLNQFTSLHALRHPGRAHQDGRVRQDGQASRDHVWLYDHTRVAESGKPTVIDESAVMWLECNHDLNARLHMFMSDYTKPVFDTAVYERFSLDPAEFSIVRRGKAFEMLAFAAGARAARMKNKARRALRGARTR